MPTPIDRSRQTIVAEEAQRANTYMVVEENGKVLHESPQEYLRKRQHQTTPSTTKNND